MAKKTKSFSHIEAQDALEHLNETKPTGEELVYDLLRIFCGYGDGNIRRIRDGVGNKAKDGHTVLIPNLIAYRPKAELDFHDEIKAMQADPKIAKHSPRLYVVSDGQTIVAFDPKELDIYENEVALMWKDFDFFYPLAGIEKIRHMEEAEADVKSAELMAKIFDEIRRHNDIKDKMEMHNLNIFMSRLLFCYFAEDTNLFPEPQLFTNSIKQHTAEDGHDLAEFIDRAFFAMSTDDPAILDTLPKQFSIFPYVNGGLFEKRVPIPVLSRRVRILMIKCGDFDWKDINPDIFGSMIQAVVTPEMRAGLGMHYTSVPNIMKLIRPLFLDGLYEEFGVAKDTHDKKRLQRLLSRLGTIKFFDPACGSGNFLIVSYKCIRELEILIWEELRKMGVPELPLSNISLQQFYGIEIDDFACDTATLSLWLAEHQMNNKFQSVLGVHTEALPLRPSGHIVCGNACRIDWNMVCPHTADEEVYVMGNPPYLGSKLQSKEQKEEVADVFKNVKNCKILDYIAIWFNLASEFINGSKSKFAFVSTNSICQGEQIAVLWPLILSRNEEITFAYTSFKWSNNAKHNAGVTVVIIGVGNEDSKNTKSLFINDKVIKTDSISPYLCIGNRIIVQKRNEPPMGLPKMCFGCMPYDNGNLLMDKEEKENFISNHYDYSRFIKPILGSYEFINKIDRFCLWIEDKDWEYASTCPEIARRVERTKSFRLSSSDASGRKLAAIPYQFREHPNLSECIIVPAVSSERREYIPIGYLDAGTVVSNSAFAIYDAPLWLFAILTSKMHMAWVKTVGGRLKTDYRYSAQLCYNTFPFPTISETQKAELAELAQEVLDLREEHFDMTLGEMYNPETMPEDLREAHRRLDLAVEHCYRTEPFASDEERLECLFKLYVKMTKK